MWVWGDNMLNKIKNLLPTKRKLMQLYFALLFNANIKGFITGNIYQGSTKKMCVPGINCYSCPGAIGACPLGSLQGSFSADHSTIYYVGGILLLYGLMLGRWICGWLCPFGLVQELFYKFKTPKLKKSPVTRLLSWLKYVILVFFVIIVPIMYAVRDIPLPAFCKYICPAGTLEGGIGLLSNAINESYFSMLGPLFTWKFLLLVSILVGCVFIFRLFCRFLCPLGALYGLFNKISFFGIQVDNDKCTHCGLCQGKCKVDIKTAGDQECISCGECIPICPTKAISWKGPKIVQKLWDPEKKSSKAQIVTRIIVGVLMVGILVGTIGWYWNQEDVRTPDPGTISTEEGNQIGDLCYSYDLELIDKNGATGEVYQPNKTGKITIINFWGTWCTPCVAELPYFQQIASEYGDQVSVIAIHSAVSRETAPDYISKHYPDSPLLFSWDGGEGFNGEYYTSLGGRGTYPYTLVLDENGIITDIFYASVTYEDLKTAVEAQIAD